MTATLQRYTDISLIVVRGLLLAVWAGGGYAAGYAVGLCVRLMLLLLLALLQGFVAATGWTRLIAWVKV